MEYSIWHRGKSPTAPWVLVALKHERAEAERTLEYQHSVFRSGQIRLVDPAGIVLRREPCAPRVAVTA